MIDANALIGTHNVLLMTLDTLRYDVACAALERGRTPTLASLLPDGRWEERHTPGSFTYAAHHAFFAGFLPTPAAPGHHPRLFAAQFAGSETTGAQTCVFDAPDIVSGLAARGYHTVCIGGVGFFNKQTALGSVLPGLFAESHWSPEMGVTDPRSTEHQIRLAVEILGRKPQPPGIKYPGLKSGAEGGKRGSPPARTEGLEGASRESAKADFPICSAIAPDFSPGADAQRLFLFVNISALHQPNCFYVPGATHDTPQTQEAALAYVDSQLPPLLTALRRLGPTLAIVCSDHGTAYGEDGYTGHRLAHPSVWTVPYAEFVLSGEV